MEIQNLKPRSGSDTIRLGDSDELVVMENFGSLPQGEISLDSHGLVVICTGGIAQFDYDGQQIQLHKNDLYLYMAHSVVTNFMSSPDFNCRQIWFSRSELWNIDMYGEVSLADLSYLKQHPTVHFPVVMPQDERPKSHVVFRYRKITRQYDDAGNALHDAEAGVGKCGHGQPLSPAAGRQVHALGGRKRRPHTQGG